MHAYNHKGRIMKLSKNTAAQMTVVGLLMIFLTLMVLSSLMDTVTDSSTNISDNLTAKGYTEEGILTKLIPLFIIVVFLATIALYGAPQP